MSSDIENNDLTTKLSSDVSNGTLTFNSNGSFEYRLMKITLELTRLHTQHQMSSVLVGGNSQFKYKSINDKPKSLNDIYTTSEDINLNITNGVLLYDNDVDNDTLSAILVSKTSNGILDFKLDGTFQYTPNKNYYGNDSFTYFASDNFLESDTATVSITVTANDAPVSEDISITTLEDIDKEITLKATDEGSD